MLKASTLMSEFNLDWCKGVIRGPQESANFIGFWNIPKMLNYFFSQCQVGSDVSDMRHAWCATYDDMIFEAKVHFSCVIEHTYAAVFKCNKCQHAISVAVAQCCLQFLDQAFFTCKYLYLYITTVQFFNPFTAGLFVVSGNIVRLILVYFTDVKKAPGAVSKAKYLD